MGICRPIWQRETAVESMTSCKMQERAWEKKNPREKEKREKFEGERVSGIGEKSRNRPKRASGYSSRSLPRTFGERFIMKERESIKICTRWRFRPRLLSRVKTEIFLDRFFLNSGVLFLFFRFLAYSRPERIPSTYSKMASFHLRSARRIPVPHYAGRDSLSARHSEFFCRRK